MNKIVKVKRESYVDDVRKAVKEGRIKPQLGSPFDIFFYANQDEKLKLLFKNILGGEK